MGNPALAMDDVRCPAEFLDCLKDSPCEENSPFVVVLEELSIGIEKCLFATEDMKFLSEPTGINLAKTAIQFSDGIIMGSGNVDKEIVDFCKESNLPVLPFNGKSLENGSYIDEYNAFYDKL